MGGHQDDDGKTPRFKAVERELRFPPQWRFPAEHFGTR
jgi:hypothetical protein